ncbi:MAG TPA: FxSxx-COOH system tetratricopeptide repeat protein, partial [Streptosporangiaceae bacterium]|nr:FxSxx-COOH system tetratricopeptide repeat protein [Streptosporangiaceae bacterium]
MTTPQPAVGRPSGRVPEVWGKIPQRNKNFTGREDLLLRLSAGIESQVTAVVPHALHGLGGVGKTQMAVEYAYRYRSEYDVVWWLPADQPVLVRSSLANLAPHLGLPPATSSGIEDAANAVLDALRRGEPYANWLLIFDNADQPEELTEIIPQGPGHVLITSRNHRWEGVVDTVAVDVFTRKESVEFLNKRVPRAINKGEADRLAHELGDLPLALEQAGALQAETGMPVAEYLLLLGQRTSQLLSEGKPTEYPVSMTAAWGLSVASLREKLPEAVDLLRCCAFFGPEPIPRDAFSRPPAGLSPQLADLIGDRIRLSRAIGELGRYALARLDIPGRTIQVHRLIQALVRDELPI